MAVISVAIRPGYSGQWLRANIYGQPLPGDRLYLRRLSRSGSNPPRRHSVKRMGHPVNPSGAAGGYLSDHLVNPSFFHGSKPWGYDYSSPIQTEWEISSHNQVIWLMPLANFFPLFRQRRPDVYVTTTRNARSFAIDFVVARPNEEKTHVTYGPASSFLRIRPHVYRGRLYHWKVEFR